MTDYKPRRPQPSFKKPEVLKFRPINTEEVYSESDDEEEMIDDYDLTAEEMQLNKEQESIVLDDELRMEYGNEFPVCSFPEAIQDYIKAAEKLYNFPTDYFGAGILSAVSAAIGNTCVGKLREGFFQSAAIMITSVGNPGALKTYPLVKALEPIYNKESHAFQSYMAALRESTGEDKNEQKQAKISPTLNRYVISDVTIEAVSKILSQNPRGILLHRDEFSGFLDAMNRYNKGDEVQKWLSIYNNISYASDRASREPFFIERPFVTVTGTIQTDMLSKFTTELRTNGFIDRVLFAFPNDVEILPWSRDEHEVIYGKRYEKAIYSLLSINQRFNEKLSLYPYEMKFNETGKGLLYDWQEYNTQLCNDYGNSKLISLYRKLEIYALRLSLIMAAFDYALKIPEQFILSPCKFAITGKHVEAALKLIEYFRVCARKVWDRLPSEGKNVVELLPEQSQKWYASLSKEFDTKTALAKSATFKIGKRTAQGYLADRNLFHKKSHGVYERKFVVVRT